MAVIRSRLTCAKRGYAFDVAEQKERLGTGHAVMMVRDAGHMPEGPVMVLLGDAPLIRPELITGALKKLEAGADVVVVGFEAKDPTGYGRLITSGEDLIAIVEEKEASPEQRQNTLCNSGLMAFSSGTLGPVLADIRDNNAKGEFYLTDAIAIARKAGKTVTYTLADETDLAGVNNRAELAAIEAEFQRRKRHSFMLAGVTMHAPDTVMLAHDTQIAADVTLEPNIVFGPGVTIETGATSTPSAILKARMSPVARPSARLRGCGRERRSARPPKSAISARSRRPISPPVPRSTTSPTSAMRPSAKKPTSALAPSPATMTARSSTKRPSARMPLSAPTPRWSLRSRWKMAATLGRAA
jgi:dTDP-glucose pyrophosphorylase